jgi:plasmid stabilization system protein ParE
VTVTFLSVAEVEFAEALSYYEQQQPGLGFQFAAEVDAAIERIVAHPEAWTSISARVRRCRIPRFPYGILYQWRLQEVLVIGVMHLRRDPISWRNRV